MLCLTVATDAGWLAAAARDLDAVLVDHAHCEMKAASHALSLVARHPGDFELSRALTALARDEIDHFDRVVVFIERRGLSLGHPPIDEYAASLRREASRLPRDGTPLLADRLLVAALIEARSCERFKLLLGAASGDAELLAFYEELFTCEARHFRTYTDLARRACGGDEGLVARRLRMVAEIEGGIVASRLGAPRAAVHG